MKARRRGGNPMTTRTVLISKTFEPDDMEEAIGWANGLVGESVPLGGFEDRVVQEIAHFQYSVARRKEGYFGDALTMVVMCFTRPDKFKMRIRHTPPRNPNVDSNDAE